MFHQGRCYFECIFFLLKNNNSNFLFEENKEKLIVKPAKLLSEIIFADWTFTAAELFWWGLLTWTWEQKKKINNTKQ